MIGANLSRQFVLDDVTAERHRQNFLRDSGKFQRTLADQGLTPSDRLAVICEEFGEVARVVCEALAGNGLDRVHLRDELVQLAACSVAWIEYLDGQVTYADDDDEPEPQIEVTVDVEVDREAPPWPACTPPPWVDRAPPTLPPYARDPLTDGLAAEVAA